VGDDETFIMEHVKESVYALRTVQAKYWSCVNGALYVESTTKSASEQFNIGYNSGKTFLKYASLFIKLSTKTTKNKNNTKN
jgi:hypothetical protein